MSAHSEHSLSEPSTSDEDLDALGVCTDSEIVSFLRSIPSVRCSTCGSRPPVLPVCCVPCGHTICMSCARDSKTCEMCGCTVENFIENILLINLLYDSTQDGFPIHGCSRCGWIGNALEFPGHKFVETLDSPAPLDARVAQVHDAVMGHVSDRWSPDAVSPEQILALCQAVVSKDGANFSDIPVLASLVLLEIDKVKVAQSAQENIENVAQDEDSHPISEKDDEPAVDPTSDLLDHEKDEAKVKLLPQTDHRPEESGNRDEAASTQLNPPTRKKWRTEEDANSAHESKGVQEPKRLVIKKNEVPQSESPTENNERQIDSESDDSENETVQKLAEEQNALLQTKDSLASVTLREKRELQLFWDIDNLRPRGVELPILLKAVLDHMVFLGVISNRSKFHARVYFVDGNSQSLLPFQKEQLRNAKCDMIQCTSRKEDADRQIASAIQRVVEKFSAKKCPIMILSSDKDFNDAVQQARSKGFDVYCVHEARPGSNHATLLGLFAEAFFVWDLLEKHCPEAARDAKKALDRPRIGHRSPPPAPAPPPRSHSDGAQKEKRFSDQARPPPLVKPHSVKENPSKNIFTASSTTKVFVSGILRPQWHFEPNPGLMHLLEEPKFRKSEWCVNPRCTKIKCWHLHPRMFNIDGVTVCAYQLILNDGLKKLLESPESTKPQWCPKKLNCSKPLSCMKLHERYVKMDNNRDLPMAVFYNNPGLVHLTENQKVGLCQSKQRHLPLLCNHLHPLNIKVRGLDGNIYEADALQFHYNKGLERVVYDIDGALHKGLQLCPAGPNCQSGKNFELCKYLHQITQSASSLVARVAASASISGPLPKTALHMGLPITQLAASPSKAPQSSPLTPWSTLHFPGSKQPVASIANLVVPQLACSPKPRQQPLTAAAAQVAVPRPSPEEVRWAIEFLRHIGLTPENVFRDGAAYSALVQQSAKLKPRDRDYLHRAVDFLRSDPAHCQNFGYSPTPYNRPKPM